MIGHGLAFARDYLAVMARGYEEHGTTFALKLGPRRVAVIADPDDLAVFFAETDQTLRTDLAYKFLVPIQGEVDMAAPPEVYRRQRPLIHEPFKAAHMPRYVRVMTERTQRWLNGLGQEGQLDIVAALQALTKDIAGTAMLGDDFPALVDHDFWALYDDIAASLDPVFPPNWPLPKFRRRDRARAQLLRLLRPIIAERRTHPGEVGDLLQTVVDWAAANEEEATDTFLENYVIGLLLAGYETTAAQAAWTIILLLRHPDALARVQNEIDQGTVERTLPARESLSGLKHTYWAVRETERLKPSAVFLLRVATADVPISGYRIPTGWTVAAAGWLAHRLPSLFRDPERFDPLRFAPDRAEDKRHRFALIGFGGGIHKCAGMSFAINEIMVITALLFRQFDVTLQTPDTQLIYGRGAPHPTPTIIHYRRRSL